MIWPEIEEYMIVFGKTHIIIDLLLIFVLFFFILDSSTDVCINLSLRMLIE